MPKMILTYSDLLGLHNLTIIDAILKDIEVNTQEKINVNTLPLDDKKTYDILAQGQTFGIFQLESAGIINILKKMNCSCFEDLVAAIALHRPGPMENVPAYLDRKNGRQPVTYLHPDLKDILEDTYGIMIYQEQVMRVTTKMAGFSMGKADILRKAISDKKPELIQSLKADFIAGATANGYPEKTAVEVFDHIERFAGYGFNRSHSVAYGMIAYQMAYLKAHYPLSFYIALLDDQAGGENQKRKCLEECRQTGIQILPPDVNHSEARFNREDGKLRYALSAVKEVGMTSAQAIVKEREDHGLFIDYRDFVGRMNRLSDRAILNLIDAGALDDFQLPRKMMKVNLDLLKQAASQQWSTALEFDLVLQDAKDQPMERLENERLALGVYLSAHPVALAREKVAGPCVRLADFPSHLYQRVTVVCRLDHFRVIKDRNGHEMCFVTISDDTASRDGVMFRDAYEVNKSQLRKGAILITQGKISVRDEISFQIQQISTFEGG